MALLIIGLIVLILLSGFFSGAEIGMMSLNRYKLKHQIKLKNKNAARVGKLLSQPDRLLSVVLIGNTVANIIASTLATLIGQKIYGDLGVAIATIILSFIVLVISELAPKTLAAMYPQQVAFNSALILTILQKVLAPIINVISFITKKILRLFGISVEKVQKDVLSREELRSLVHESGGLLPIEHKGMLLSLLDLEYATVEDIMIPKGEIIGLDLEQPWHELLAQMELSQHTKLPLYQGSIDNLVGIVHLRTVLNLSLEDELNKESLLKASEPPYFVPEATSLNAQLLNFRKTKKRSCFVVDEYGDLQGLVTLEDILEEVVGEFTTDIAALSKDIIPQEDGSYIIDASITLRQMQRLLNWQLPNLGPRTLNGLIIEYLGYIPPADCCLRIDSYQIEILKVSENMIKSVKILKNIKRQLSF